jgi:hypothetical protein
MTITSNRNISLPKFNAMAWATAVRNISKKSDFLIEKEFMPECCKDVDGRPKTPGLFTKYAKGKSAPTQQGNKCGGLDFVDRIEREYPNTKCWLLHPLWIVLSTDDLKLPEIWQIMVNCKINNKRSFFLENSDHNLVRLGSITLKKLLKLEKSKQLIEVVTFLIGLIRESEIRLDVRSHHIVVNRILALLPRFCDIPEFKDFAGALIDYMELKFFRVSYDIPDSAARIIFPKSWREIYPEISKHVSGMIESDNIPDNYRSLFQVAFRKSDSMYEFKL